MPRFIRPAVLGGVLSLLAATAQASTAPVTLDLTFKPPLDASWPAGAIPKSGADGTTGGACRVALAEVTDRRADPRSLGALNGKVFEANDTAGWLRAGFRALSRDPRIQVVDRIEPGDAGVVLNAEMLKAYAINVTSETRSVNVVLRVKYGGADASEGQIYRGTDDAVTWIDSEGETESSFNDALAQLLKAVDHDVIARCAKPAP